MGTETVNDKTSETTLPKGYSEPPRSGDLEEVNPKAGDGVTWGMLFGRDKRTGAERLADIAAGDAP